MKSGSSSETRKKILETANFIVLQNGAAALTLDAVAHQAGISKGGLLYHFPSKDSLIEGMIQALIDSADEAMKEIESSLPRKKGSWTLAYIRACTCSEETDHISAALITAAANKPELIEPLRQRYQYWQKKLDEDLQDESLATLIRLSLDGLWMVDLLNISPPSRERRQKFLNLMTELINRPG